MWKACAMAVVFQQIEGEHWNITAVLSWPALIVKGHVFNVPRCFGGGLKLWEW